MPQGATPRSLHVHLRGGLTRSAKPGDAVTIAGIFLPQPLTGFRVRAPTPAFMQQPLFSWKTNHLGQCMPAAC